MNASLATQTLLIPERVEHDALIIKGGGLRRLVLVSGLNFELRSEEEQGVALAGFQGMLNSLDFPLQIFIHSRKVNIEPYLNTLQSLERAEGDKLLASLTGEYRAFIASLVAQNPIMEKRFFVVVPYDPNPYAETGAGALNRLLRLFKKQPPEPAGAVPAAPTTQAAASESAFVKLDQRTDQVINGLTQLGLRAIALNGEEITELFYTLYNHG